MSLRESIRKIFTPALVEAPQMGELASTESAMYAGFNLRAWNPDKLVRLKGGLQVYDEMRLDEQVKACLALKKHAVLASGWTIEPASDSQEDQDIADFVTYNLNKMAGTLTAVMLELLTALDYGYSISELVWQVYSDGPYAGMVGLKAIKSKRPHFYSFQVDPFGNLLPDGLIHQGTWYTGLLEERLPVNKFIIYTYQKEFDNWYGISDLRPAYRPWWSKDNVIRFWNIYLERFGSPLMIGRYKTSDPNKVNELKTILKNIQSKTSIVMQEGQFDIGLIEPQRRSTADYDTAIQHYDKAIARSILVPDQLSGTEVGGAYAKAKVHFDVFLWVITKLRSDIEDEVFGEQVIRRIVEYNYAGTLEMPKLKFNPLTDQQRMELATAFADAVQKGAIRPASTDEEYLRETLNFPPVDTTTDPLILGRKAAGGMPVIPPPTQQKSMSLVDSRPFTVYEKRVDFKKVDSALKVIETKNVEGLRKTLVKQRDALIVFVSSKLVNGGLSTSLINTGIDLKYKGDLKSGVRDMFQQTYDLGGTDGRSELGKKFVVGRHGISVTPQKALDYLQAKADFVVAGITEPLTSATKAILLQAIRDGLPLRDVINELQAAYDPYLSDGSVLVDGEQATAYRLETIVRTNMSEAYNYGRRAVGEDSALEGYVVGYQFSEILDDRTTDLSRFVDGLIIEIDSPYLSELTYPLHWNDRGMFVFVTKDDLPVEFMADADAEEAIREKNVF